MLPLTERPNILVVCGKNKRRSRTAEHLFKNDARFAIRSAGLSPKSEHKISEKDLHWADLVLVMENEHRAKIRDLFKHQNLPEIKVLRIPDEYAFMDDELIDILRVRINEVLNSHL